MKTTFNQTHPYIAAILIGLLCTFLTALGVAIPQAIELDTYQIYLCATFVLILSVAIGLLIMAKSNKKLNAYGIKSSDKNTSRSVWWYAPLILMEIIPVLVYGFSGEITVYQYLIIAFFTIAVGFNEEIYFRGLILQYLTVKGKKNAVIGSAVIFGVLHMVNALNGKNMFYVVLQMSFAFLVGFVLAEIVCITKSLWIVILWHASHDFISMTTEGELDTKALILLAIQVMILLVYAIGIWKKSTVEE